MGQYMKFGQSEEYRKLLFNYLDGIAIIPTISALNKKKILQYIANNQGSSFKTICVKYDANPGYLNVAFRLLVSQGWIKRDNYIDGKDYSIYLENSGVDLIISNTLCLLKGTELNCLESRKKYEMEN